MSRIILDVYDNGDIKYVVGWDRPCNSYFWQHFSQEMDDDGNPFWEKDKKWQEMVDYAGYLPNDIIDIPSLKESAPEDIERLITPQVTDLLRDHRHRHPDPGRIIIDMTKTPPTVEQR